MDLAFPAERLRFTIELEIEGLLWMKLGSHAASKAYLVWGERGGKWGERSLARYAGLRRQSQAAMTVASNMSCYIV